jgi:hypothetical protein
MENISSAQPLCKNLLIISLPNRKITINPFPRQKPVFGLKRGLKLYSGNLKLYLGNLKLTLFKSKLTLGRNKLTLGELKRYSGNLKLTLGNYKRYSGKLKTYSRRNKLTLFKPTFACFFLKSPFYAYKIINYQTKS